MLKANSMSARILFAIGALILGTLVVGCQQQAADAEVLGQAAKTIMMNNVEIYNTGNMNLVETVISPQYVGHYSSMPEPVIGRQGFIDWVQRNRAGYSDFSVVINEMVAENNMIAIQWTVTGTNDGMILDREPTGKPVRIKGLTLARIEEGKIVEEWITWDMLDFNRQLGIEAVPQGM